MRNKITIVGAGNVGASAAQWIAEKSLGDIMLIDVKKGIAKGKALDLMQAMPIAKKDVKITAAEDYKETKNSDLVIITAGVPRKPGMSRDTLIGVNVKIMIISIKSLISRYAKSIHIRKYAPIP